MNETEIFHGIQYIALFMGWNPDDLRTYLTVKYTQTTSLGKLAFNESWDLLMPVVQKVDKFLDDNLQDTKYKNKGIYHLHSRFKQMSIALPIESVFADVVKFTKWYHNLENNHCPKCKCEFTEEAEYLNQICFGCKFDKEWKTTKD